MTPISVALTVSPPGQTPVIETAPTAHQYSGIVFNQNQAPNSGNFVSSTGVWYYQDFFIPNNYTRGTNDSELFVPDLSGFQLLAGVTDSSNISLDWNLQYDLLGSGWQMLSSGTVTDSQADADKVWLDVFFDDGLNISELLNQRFRFGFKINSGLSKVWYSNPNPLVLQNAKLYQADGLTPVQTAGTDVSILFRLLALCADDGVDFLGNNYRSVVSIFDPNDISRLNGDRNRSWMSDPAPSRFAVKNLYFDLRPNAPTQYIEDPLYLGSNIFIPSPPTIDDQAVVIDSVLVDPLTPGVYFNVYYSNDGDAVNSSEEWDDKLWTHVPRTYRAVKRETHVFPEPILARYIKLEFSHLQAQSYNPGDLNKPIKYSKHPKWVLDYFLARTEAQNKGDNRLLANTVSVVYDALDLAYNYYLDDLGQEPDKPVEIDPSYESNVTQFLQNRGDASDQADPTTLAKINLSLAPYREHPSVFAKDDYLLGQYARQAASLTPDYPVEMDPSLIDSPDVRVLRNEAVVFESDYPVMFFYLTCRHKYREVIADFSHNRAYFAGVRELAFTRENYTVANDTDRYQEPGGDLINTDRNDFIRTDGVMTV